MTRAARDGGAAACILALIFVRHYLWELVPSRLVPAVWNACGAIVILCLLLYIGWRLRGIARLALLYFMYEELQVAGCWIWWLIEPFERGAKRLCEGRLNINFLALGGVAMVWLCLATLDRMRHGGRQ